MTQKNKIVYVTRDIERALGTMPNTDYHIVTNRSSYAEDIKRQYPTFVTLIDSRKGPLDTAELLTEDSVKKIIDNFGGNILVFKNTNHIEDIAKENNWKLLNPSAQLSELTENKVSQVKWLGDIGDKYLPKHSIIAVKNIIWNKEPLIIQWAHSHTGEGTLLINSAKELSDIQEKFPDRDARVSSFVNGPSFTLNVVVGKNILLGNISYQITGLPPFTDNPFSTIGNDWSLTHSLLNEKEVKFIETIALEIGNKMKIAGWKGLFGIDVMRDDNSNQIFLIEINSRQPASTSFESILQEENRKQGVVGITTFEAHLKTLQGQDVNESIIPINDGAQILHRITKNKKVITEDGTGSLELAGYQVITYSNTEINSDLIRIQSNRGIMETHGKFNMRGKEILEILM